MSRHGFTRVELLVVMLVLAVLLACIGVMLPFEILFRLAGGWIFYLVRTLPEVTFSWMGAATAAVTLIAVTIAAHLLGGWWVRNARPPGDESAAPAQALTEDARQWPVRRTILCVSLVLLLFVAGLSGTGIAHQTAWLVTSPEPLADRSGDPARWTVTRNNLKQIGLGLHNYHDVLGSLPAGGTFDAAGRGLHSWQTFVLPFVEQDPLYRTIDLARPWNHPVNGKAVATSMPVFRNPGVDRGSANDAPGRPAPSHYAANAHLFGANRQVKFAEITDGLSNTLLSGEVTGNVKAWADPTNVRDPVLGINKTPDGFGGPWEGGAQFLLGDGSVRFINEEIDPAVLEALATPGAGDRVGEF